jgi:diguanylate cyclase (GGDEF)-like protein
VEFFPPGVIPLPPWNQTLRSLIVPGGILLAGVALLAHSGWLRLAPPTLTFLYYSTLVAGVLLAWRFHAHRILFAALVIFLANQAVALSGGTPAPTGTPGWTVLVAAAALVPVNLVLIALSEEGGFTVSASAPLALFLFVQIVIVAVLARSSDLVPSRVPMAMGPLPGYVVVVSALAGVILLVRALLTHKPADGALFWSLGAFFLSLHFASTARIANAYSVAALMILATSVVETSYLLAYHDELTMLPSRRAFNDAVLRLEDPYSIAAVDIDHFKKFNDTYGHEVGDQVLRLVAANLARVTGGGQAYRCGGEEFAILFRGKTAAEAREHLERLRSTIEHADFRMRVGERRQVARGPDRRTGRLQRRPRKADAIRRLARAQTAETVSVTVSIGVAASSAQTPAPDLVLQSADKALYRAKANGRNRLEIAASPRRRDRAKATGVA